MATKLLENAVMVHVLTYDFAGTNLATGAAKPCRTTGLVTHTHQLLVGWSRIVPNMRLALTHTGRTRLGGYYLRTTAGGKIALAQGIATGFPDLLSTPGRPGKDPARVQHFYEDEINRHDNPVYRALAQQYAHVIRVAGTRNLLAQNINPIISVLKAEEYGDMPADQIGQLAVTGVVHDTADVAARFSYLASRIPLTEHRVRLIAISSPVHDALVAAGIPEQLVHTVPNGLDVAQFEQRLADARSAGAFRAVRARNGLPATGDMILMSARRVAWKGHLDLIEGARLITRRGITGFYVVINGNGMTDTREPDYENELRHRIATAGLTDRVYLLDDLSSTELAACYDAATVAVHPSRHPEPWGYSNIEAMLANTALITTDHGAPASYITHGQSGLLVTPHDPAAIADALARLLTDRDERGRLALAGRLVARQFTVEAMARAYHRVITRP